MKSTTTTGTDGELARHAPASASSGSKTRTISLAIACGLVAFFLISIGRFYHPDSGFTILIGFPAANDHEVPALRAVPHYSAALAYDGQFYAQRALDPLLRDPSTDRATDLAPFRARRILFSWTAYVVGLGRPAWILEAYALQNVAAWLILAFALVRWVPPTTPRGLAAWCACLFSHGLLWSVRLSLLDGPSLLLTAFAVKLAEDGHAFASAALVGVNGLGRETNVLGALSQAFPRGPRAWLRIAGIVLLVVLPILIWEDYLRSIYRSTIFAAVDAQTEMPGAAIVHTFGEIWTQIRTKGLLSSTTLQACIVVPLLVQAAFLVWRPRIEEPWWRVAIGYVALMLVLDRVLWNPAVGAITRVLLPMTVGFNILLLREARARGFWLWFVAGNLHLVPALRLL
jgi:hypothetical protein